MNRHQLAKRTKHLTQWGFIHIPAIMETITVNGSLLKGKKGWLEESGLIDWYKFDDLTHMYEAGDSEKFERQRFTDEYVTVSQQIRYGITTELIETKELRHWRNDTPDILTYWEQGTKLRTNEWMDGDSVVTQDQRKLKKLGRKLLSDGKHAVGIMNDRDFRERCVVVGNTVQAVQDVTGEEDLRIMHKPEWVEEQLECDFEDAVTIATAFTRLGISRGIVYKMINGYWDDVSMTWKKGLKKIGRSQSAHYAEVFENLCKELEDVIDEDELNRQYFYAVSQGMIESGDWCLQYGTNQPYWNDQMAYIEESVLLADGNDMLQVIEIDDDEFEGYIDHFGDEELEPVLNPTNTWRLFNGSETLDHDTISMIKSATICQYKNDKCKGDCNDIGSIVKKMYPQWKNRRKQPAEWGYNKTWWLSGWMTEPQTRQAWWYINDARNRIAQEVKPHMTKISKAVVRQACGMNIKRARAYIATYCAGNKFDMDGKEISWDHKPSEIEKYAIWSEYNTNKGG